MVQISTESSGGVPGQRAKQPAALSKRTPGAQRGRGRRRGNALTMALLVAPSVILLLLVNVYPVGYAALQSVRDGSLVSSGDFVGVGNYVAIVGDSAFWSAASFTLVFTICGVFGSWALGLALAMLLRSGIPNPNLFKVLLLLPWVVPVVVSTTSWNWLVATPQSPAPILLQALGFDDILFLADPSIAKVVVCVFKVWISFPFMMMMMSAALASVDENVYEAAKMDGASAWQTFRSMTLPLISRPVYVSWILMTIFCVNDFPTVFLLTGGGPADSTNTLIVMAYKRVFMNFQTGPGVAIAFVMTAVLVLISVFLFQRIRRVDVA